MSPTILDPGLLVPSTKTGKRRCAECHKDRQRVYEKRVYRKRKAKR